MFKSHIFFLSAFPSHTSSPARGRGEATNTTQTNVASRTAHTGATEDSRRHSSTRHVLYGVYCTGERLRCHVHACRAYCFRVHDGTGWLGRRGTSTGGMESKKKKVYTFCSTKALANFEYRTLFRFWSEVSVDTTKKSFCFFTLITHREGSLH